MPFHSAIEVLVSHLGPTNTCNDTSSPMKVQAGGGMDDWTRAYRYLLSDCTTPLPFPLSILFAQSYRTHSWFFVASKAAAG